jgi:hypothetical protein
VIDRVDGVCDNWEVHKGVLKARNTLPYYNGGGTGSKYDGLEPEHLRGQATSEIILPFVTVLFDVGYRGSSLLDAAFISVPRWTGEKDIVGLTIVGQARLNWMITSDSVVDGITVWFMHCSTHCENKPVCRRRGCRRAR